MASKILFLCHFCRSGAGTGFFGFLADLAFMILMWPPDPSLAIAKRPGDMVTDAEGKVGDALHLSNGASKGKRGERTVPLNKELRAALVALKDTRNSPDATDRIIHSERDAGMSPVAVQVWFHRLYQSLGFVGASSHSGRRTFVTRCAKKIIEAGGSLRDVQELAGHASLSTTQRYIQGDLAAKRGAKSSVAENRLELVLAGRDAAVPHADKPDF